MLQDPALRLGAAPGGPQTHDTVLVLDDSHAQRQMLSTLLRKWGHPVITCADPGEALAHAHDARIGLIISDWMMPHMTGPEFCRRWRGTRRDGYAYIILLTSNSDSGALAEGLEAGADDFLNKPVRPPELRARLNAGGRIVTMQRELVEKNRQLGSALGEIQNLYTALDRDLDEARRLQQASVQDRFRRFGNVDISLWLKASGHVGGDMLGYFPVTDRVIGIFSLDVSGHGVASAMIAARIAGILSDASPDQNIALIRREDGSLSALPPNMAAARLNHMLLKELQSDRYFTLCLGFLNLMTGDLRLVQAGHPHPLLLRASGELEQVGDGGLPIGLLEDATYEVTKVTLGPGDRILLYSDGLSECPGPDGLQLEDEGLARLVRKNASATGAAFLAGLERDIAQHADTANLPDDASALWLEFNAM